MALFFLLNFQNYVSWCILLRLESRLYSIPEPERTKIIRPGLVATEFACSAPREAVSMGKTRSVIREVIQWSKKYAFSITFTLSLVNIGLGYIQTWDSGTADSSRGVRFRTRASYSSQFFFFCGNFCL